MAPVRLAPVGLMGTIGYNRDMSATISISEPLSHTAFRLARKLGISLEELCAEAIEEYVRARDRSDRYHGVTESLDRLYSNEPSELEPGLARIQAEALEQDDWDLLPVPGTSSSPVGIQACPKIRWPTSPK